MNPLVYYIGQEALGEQKQGFKVSKFFKGILNHSSFIKMDEDKSFTAKPYLRSLSMVTNADKLAVRELISTDDNWISAVASATRAINYLREHGYDCDGLIDQGLALLHPDYDAKSLL